MNQNLEDSRRAAESIHRQVVELQRAIEQEKIIKREPIPSAVAMTDVTLVRRAQRCIPSQWTVQCAGELVGLIERHKWNESPWIAYLGTQQWLGQFTGQAGRIMARNAILRAAGLLN